MPEELPPLKLMRRDMADFSDVDGCHRAETQSGARLAAPPGGLNGLGAHQENGLNGPILKIRTAPHGSPSKDAGVGVSLPDCDVDVSVSASVSSSQSKDRYVPPAPSRSSDTAHLVGS